MEAAGAQSKCQTRPFALCANDRPGTGRNPEAHGSNRVQETHSRA